MCIDLLHRGPSDRSTSSRCSHNTSGRPKARLAKNVSPGRDASCRYGQPIELTNMIKPHSSLLDDTGGLESTCWKGLLTTTTTCYSASGPALST
ncbi:hypothetical protein M404DRAFT_413646 [Pisolithus tinctorius Marx 270]|uniref:Uncharacterized protein n=1 Tax=Pisolithus tinctorius Marx 270 TaxID=870435 RepID=A0A0C3NEC7_PISTI|nr:hypothetical protein M404DRAFT_413646 [Pisolithus tinctorius Marx 270]